MRRGRGAFAMATLIAVAALAAALIGDALAAHARADAARAARLATVQLTAPDDDSVAARAAAVLGALPGVRSATPIDRDRAAALIAAAGGAAVDPATLPEPRLVEVARDPAVSDAAMIDALRGAGVSGMVFSPEPPPPAPLALADFAGLAAALALLAALALALKSGVREQDFALLADLGAARADALAHAGREGFSFGFAAGLAAAVVTAAGAAGVLSVAGHPLSLADMAIRISPTETALVLLAPLAVAAAAMLGARAGAASAYDRADRLG